LSPQGVDEEAAKRPVARLRRPLPRGVFLVLAVAWAAVIWSLSASPGKRGPKPFVMRVVWNGGHAAVFAVLSLLLLSGLPAARAARIAGIAACVVYGVVDEWHQSFVPGRAATVTDWITDTSGAVFGWAVVSLLASLRAPRDDSRRRLVVVLASGAACVAAALVATLRDVVL